MESKWKISLTHSKGILLMFFFLVLGQQHSGILTTVGFLTRETPRAEVSETQEMGKIESFERATFNDSNFDELFNISILFATDEQAPSNSVSEELYNESSYDNYTETAAFYPHSMSAPYLSSEFHFQIILNTTITKFNGSKFTRKLRSWFQRYCYSRENPCKMPKSQPRNSRPKPVKVVRRYWLFSIRPLNVTFGGENDNDTVGIIFRIQSKQVPLSYEFLMDTLLINQEDLSLEFGCKILHIEPIDKEFAEIEANNLLAAKRHRRKSRFILIGLIGVSITTLLMIIGIRACCRRQRKKKILCDDASTITEYRDGYPEGKRIF